MAHRKADWAILGPGSGPIHQTLWTPEAIQSGGHDVDGTAARAIDSACTSSIEAIPAAVIASRVPSVPSPCHCSSDPQPLTARHGARGGRLLRAVDDPALHPPTGTTSVSGLWHTLAAADRRRAADVAGARRGELRRDDGGAPLLRWNLRTTLTVLAAAQAVLAGLLLPLRLAAGRSGPNRPVGVRGSDGAGRLVNLAHPRDPRPESGILKPPSTLRGSSSRWPVVWLSTPGHHRAHGCQRRHPRGRRAPHAPRLESTPPRTVTRHAPAADRAGQSPGVGPHHRRSALLALAASGWYLAVRAAAIRDGKAVPQGDPLTVHRRPTPSGDVQRSSLMAV